MGIDYKKKYLKYKNKYLEAKKIYGGADESIKIKIEELRNAIEGLRNSGISDMIDELLIKCSECENTQQVEALEEEVRLLKESKLKEEEEEAARLKEEEEAKAKKEADAASKSVVEKEPETDAAPVAEGKNAEQQDEELETVVEANDAPEKKSDGDN